MVVTLLTAIVWALTIEMVPGTYYSHASRRWAVTTTSCRAAVPAAGALVVCAAVWLANATILPLIRSAQTPLACYISGAVHAQCFERVVEADAFESKDTRFKGCKRA